MGDENEWIVAGAGKKSWKRRQGKGWSGSNPSAQRQKCHSQGTGANSAAAASGKYAWNPAVLDQEVDEKKVAKLMERTCSAQRIMRESKFCAQFRQMLDLEKNQRESASGSGINTLLSILSTVEEIVVYGLGSLENGPPACKYQFALAELLAEEVFNNNQGKVKDGKAFFFDPAFTAYDRKVIESNRDHRFVVMRENEQCARPTSKPTLFYMPHCEAELYDSLLRSNWNEKQLSNLIILGNSFATYKLRWGLSSEHKPKCSVEYPVLVSAAECACEVPVSDCNFIELSAVNDMSFHCFPKDAIQCKLFDEKCC